jgi:hypothetical protein
MQCCFVYVGRTASVYFTSIQNQRTLKHISSAREKERSTHYEGGIRRIFLGDASALMLSQRSLTRLMQNGAPADTCSRLLRFQDIQIG